MLIMWVGSILPACAALSSVVAQLVDNYANINEKITATILIASDYWVLQGYQANINFTNLVSISYLKLQQN